MSILLRFRTRLSLEEHFDAHGDALGAKDEAEYESMAAVFLGGELPAYTLECIRASDNARIRYNYVTQEFGTVSADNFIQTYFKPDPKWHGKSTNRAYFEAECKKKW